VTRRLLPAADRKDLIAAMVLAERDAWSEVNETHAPDSALAEPRSLARLALTDFRSYETLRLALSPAPVVLSGPNGAGKTNLLEAVSLLAPGRGLRGARLAELARADARPQARWAVSATLGDRAATTLATGRDPGADAPADRRIVRIDGETKAGQASLAQHLSIVWLTPQMDGLFLDSPAARRRFLDRLVFAFDPPHVGRVQRYEKAVRERAALLAERREGARIDEVWLTALERTIAETGIAVAAGRADLVARLARAGARGVSVFPQARLSLDGWIDEMLARTPALAAEDAFAARLAAARFEDASSGTTAYGPHRSDWRVAHAGKDMPAELCSTGEQKALLIAIILAHARLIAAERGAAPLLLLDDVAAHLDAARRAALFDEIAALGVQAWMTGTDESLFQPLARAQRFRIEDSRVLAV
jgi:DNA replication and repair protein RecF